MFKVAFAFLKAFEMWLLNVSVRLVRLLSISCYFRHIIFGRRI